MSKITIKELLSLCKKLKKDCKIDLKCFIPQAKNHSFLSCNLWNSGLVVLEDDMPLVKINMLAGKTTEFKKTLFDCIHQGLIDAFEIADWDRFQRIEEFDKTN